MRTYMNVAILAALCLAAVSLPAKGPERDTELLDQIITQEIGSRQESIKHWTRTLTVKDMSLDVQVRIATFMDSLEQEMAYLDELKTHGSIRLKKAYCKMILQQRISIMRYEIKFKKQFGARSEALPKSQAQKLSGKQVEAIQKQLKGTVTLKKKIESIAAESTPTTSAEATKAPKE